MDTLEACRVVGRQLGLPVADLTVLSDRGNVIVRFSPAPVVARVCGLTAFTRRDPFAWLAREVAVVQFAVQRGGDVVAPTSHVDPGPYTVGGIHLSLWQHVEIEPQLPTADEVGVALADLHECLQAFPGDLPLLAPAVDQIQDGLHALDGRWDSRALLQLGELHQKYLSETSYAPNDFVLHGDAHPGNLLRVGGRWLWTDFEETCRGSVLWDLAILQRNSRVDGSTAVRAYCRKAKMPVPTEAALRPYMRLRDIEAAVWAAGLATQDQRYGPTAADLLAKALRLGETRS